MNWAPHVTVAAVIEHHGRYLMVEEETDEGVRINQPAGHWERGESLAAASVRETLEETGHPFTPTHLLGIYHWSHPGGDITYLRFAFIGNAGTPRPGYRLDLGILRAVWLSHDELLAQRARHRSPLVLKCVEDHLAGIRHPLTLLTHCER